MWGGGGAGNQVMDGCREAGHTELVSPMLVETMAHFLTRLSHTYLLPEVARLASSPLPLGSDVSRFPSISLLLHCCSGTIARSQARACALPLHVLVHVPHATP